jgi:S-adenosylmethionine:tRNA ribosyltransferase-isomerase
LRDVIIAPEWYMVPKRTVQDILKAKRNGKRIVAVGTTVARALESSVDKKGRLIQSSGWTNLTIVPGFRFKIVDAFLTNFHLPGSSHLLMTCAFGGNSRVLEAYRKALSRKYGFLDFGDSMFITAEDGIG